jgi:hypothetical protein
MWEWGPNAREEKHKIKSSALAMEKIDGWRFDQQCAGQSMNESQETTCGSNGNTKSSLAETSWQKILSNKHQPINVGRAIPLKGQIWDGQQIWDGMSFGSEQKDEFHLQPATEVDHEWWGPSQGTANKNDVAEPGATKLQYGFCGVKKKQVA